MYVSRSQQIGKKQQYLLQFEQMLHKAFNNLSFPFHVFPVRPVKRILRRALLCCSSMVDPNLLATVATALAALN